MSLANAVRDRRAELGLSQRELAERAKVDHTLISHFERGKHTNPTVATLRTLATALDLSFEELLIRASMIRNGDNGNGWHDPLDGLPVESRRAIQTLIKAVRQAGDASSRLLFASHDFALSPPGATTARPRLTGQGLGGPNLATPVPQRPQRLHAAP